MSRCILVPHHIVVYDDTALDAGADVGPVNLWMHSLFSDVSVSLNEKLVSPPTSLYSYRVYSKQVSISQVDVVVLAPLTADS
jgi:hypothetical protein